MPYKPPPLHEFPCLGLLFHTIIIVLSKYERMHKETTWMVKYPGLRGQGRLREHVVRWASYNLPDGVNLSENYQGAKYTKSCDFKTKL